MPRETTKKEVEDFIHEYYQKHNTTPKLTEWKLKNGFPCNKEKVLQLFGKYNDLISSLGYETFSYGQRRYDKKKLLEELLEAVKQHRSVDFRYIREGNNLKHRDIYTAQFGSVRKALKLAGIDNNNILLMKDFRDYDFTSPKYFLIKKLYGGKISKEQLDLIEQGKELIRCGFDITRDSMAKHLSIRNVYTYFKKFPYFVVMCDTECRLTNKQQYEAKDGHICDSYEEYIIDNLLYSNGISHSVHKKYPNSKLISDFEVNGVLIEYTGFQDIGGNIAKRYLERLEEKRAIAAKNKIVLLEVSNVKQDTLDDFMQRLYSVMSIEKPCELLEVPESLYAKAEG